MILNTDYNVIDFSVQLEVVNGTGLVHSCDLKDDTFCPINNSNYKPKWKLCNGALNMTFSPKISYQKEQRDRDRENDREKNQIDALIAWLSILHGSLPATFPFILPYNDDYDYDYDYDEWGYHTSVSMTLVIQQLDCNPSITMLQCAMSDILHWVCGWIT